MLQKYLSYSESCVLGICQLYIIADISERESGQVIKILNNILIPSYNWDISIVCSVYRTAPDTLAVYLGLFYKHFCYSLIKSPFSSKYSYHLHSHSCYSNRQLFSPPSYFCPAKLIGFYILVTPTDRCSVLHLISVPHS